MSVVLGTIASQAIAILNAATSYTSTASDPRFYTQQISDTVLSIDSQVCEAINRNRDHPRRTLFYITQSGVASGGTIANTAGEIDTVVFVVSGGSYAASRAGIEWDKEELLRENDNALGLTAAFRDAHYAMDGRVLYHNGVALASCTGGSVSVNVTFPQFSRTAACQAPDEYYDVVLAGSVAQLAMVEGENVAMAQAWWAQFQALLGNIAVGETTVPSYRSVNQVGG